MIRPTTQVLAIAAALSVAACDKGNDAPTDEPSGTEEATPAVGNESAAEGDQQQAAVGDQQQAAAEANEDDGTYEPGSVGIRVANTLDEPVDLYVRTTGRVRAFQVAEGLAAGAVSEWFFPPEGGGMVALPVGGEDLTCISRCDHFIAQVRPQESDGNANTVILHTFRDSDRGTAFWENPSEEQQGRSSNAMVPATADKGTFVVHSSGLQDARFGLRLGYAGVEGCQTPATTENQLIGGTAVPGFTIDGAVDVVLYSNSDRECSEDPVGGPFTVDVSAGERAHLILDGSPNDMSATVVPMAGPDGPAN